MNFQLALVARFFIIHYSFFIINYSLTQQLVIHQVTDAMNGE